MNLRTRIDIGVNYCSKERNRGVFACMPFKTGDVVEECHIIEVVADILTKIQPLNTYYYAWSDTHDALVLGNGSLYNHSFTPNCVYKRDYEKKIMNYIALRDIAEGEELCVNYNGDPTDMSEWNFDGSLNEGK